MKKEQQITVYSYGKINLSLDVLGVTADGYHEVEMIMQAIMLHDHVLIKWDPFESGSRLNEDGDEARIIDLHTDVPYVPDDNRNIAYKAAALMLELFPENKGRISIDIKKRIPVAAGLAGGSGNGAAVIMGLARLWKLDLPLDELMDIGARLGSDVPFSIMSQAACNSMFGYKSDKMAATCALATGRGTHLKPLKALPSWVLLAKPPLSVSTAEVYKGIDSCMINSRPDNVRLAEAISAGNKEGMRQNMINVLENYTLQRYYKVNTLKKCIEKSTTNDEIVLMTGSGPTIFALCDSREEGKELGKRIGRKGSHVILTRTLV